jgi:hypothetical protein
MMMRNSISGTWLEFPSPPFRGEREGPAPQAWEGEVGAGGRSGIPHLTLSAPSPLPSLPRKRGRVGVGALSAPRGGEGANKWRCG